MLQAGGKWFNWAPNKAKCEVPGYAWKKGAGAMKIYENS